MTNLLRRVVQETEMLGFVDQELYVTSVGVCKSWNEAHAEQDLAGFKYPEDCGELKEGLELGHPFTSTAIQTAMDSLKHGAFCKEIWQGCGEFYQLIWEHMSMIPTETRATVLKAFYHNAIALTGTFAKHGPFESLWYIFDWGSDEEKQEHYELELQVVADCSAYYGDWEIIKDAMCTFACYSCEDFEEHDAEQCTCGDSAMRKVFASAILEDARDPLTIMDCDAVEWAITVPK